MSRHFGIDLKFSSISFNFHIDFVAINKNHISFHFDEVDHKIGGEQNKKSRIVLAKFIYLKTSFTVLTSDKIRYRILWLLYFILNFFFQRLSPTHSTRTFFFFFWFCLRPFFSLIQNSINDRNTEAWPALSRCQTKNKKTKILISFTD